MKGCSQNFLKYSLAQRWGITQQGGMRGDYFLSLFIGIPGTSLHPSALAPMQVHFEE